MKKHILAIFAASVWVLISEFIRNEFLLKSIWTGHYNNLGLTFETLPVNVILWMEWSILFAFIIFKLFQRFSFLETFLMAWVQGFLMMWITLFNLQVLPMRLLLFAIPLSALEVLLAQLILEGVGRSKK